VSGEWCVFHSPLSTHHCVLVSGEWCVFHSPLSTYHCVLVGIDLVSEQMGKFTGAVRHVEHEVVQLAVGATANAPLRLVVGPLSAVENEGDFVG